MSYTPHFNPDLKFGLINRAGYNFPDVYRDS